MKIAYFVSFVVIKNGHVERLGHATVGMVPDDPQFLDNLLKDVAKNVECEIGEVQLLSVNRL